MTPVTTEARHAGLEDLAAILRDQHGRKLDVVCNATAVRSENGILHIEDTEPIIDTGGVTLTSGYYRPTVVCDEGLSAKLGVPVGYLKHLRSTRPDLYDANVNGWLHGGVWETYDLNGDKHPHAVAADTRNFLVRCFKGDHGEGVARAFLSDGFRRIDNLDVLTAALDGARQAGTDVVVEGCDLSERKMQVRLVAPSISAMAETLLRGYRSPFDQGAERAGGRDLAAVRNLMEGYEGTGHSAHVEHPIVWAGVVISNSETGGGKFLIVPRFVVKVCMNGLTMTADAVGQIHLGGRMDEGIVQWSDETQEANLELIRGQARDAMTTFLNVEYLTAKLTDIEERAGTAITRPEQTVKRLGQHLRLTQTQTDEVLAHFIMGGQMNAGGVVNAMTSVAQTIADPDAASDLEGMAMRALEFVAS